MESRVLILVVVVGRILVKLNSVFILKQISESATFISLGRASVDFKRLTSFDNVGTFLVERLQKNVAFDQLTEATL